MSSILVVDDDVMNTKMTEFVLKTKYEDVFCVNNGYDCIQALNDCIYDLILLDIEMPDMSGHDVLKQIRTMERYKNLPVIFLTASADVRDVIAAKSLNASNYIVKPYLPEVLLEKVEAVLG